VSGAFLDEAAREFGLALPERAFLEARGIGSHDRMHAVLRAAAGLEALWAPGRRALLIGALLPRLSPGYRAALARPAPAPPIPGAALSVPPPPPPSGEPQEPWPPPAPDWIGRYHPRALSGPADTALDLRAQVSGPWPVRDQGAAPLCVPYAAVACLEWLWRGRAPRLSPEFLYACIAAQRGLGRNGGTKLGQVRDVLQSLGIATAEDFPPDMPLTRAPKRGVLARARERRRELGRIAYWDLGTLRTRWQGAARTVLELLKAGVPVAISIPEHQEPLAGPDAPSDWWQPLTVASGEVPDPAPDAPPPRLGHAVCILGFQPDPNEALGGWFIFRNSLGERWSTDAPVLGDVTPPIVPAAGHGAISARHVEEHVYEIFAPGLH
jgi:hypothetical protein